MSTHHIPCALLAGALVITLGACSDPEPAPEGETARRLDPAPPTKESPVVAPAAVHPPEIQELLAAINGLDEEDPGTLGQLANHAKHESAAVRTQVAGRLEDIGGSGAIAMLRDLLRDPEPTVRLRVIESLDYIAEPEAFAVVATALRDVEKQVRAEAVTVLTYAEASRHLGELRAALGAEQDEEIKDLLQDAVDELSDPDL